MITRRHFAVITSGALAGFALDACRGGPRGADDGRLTARPRANVEPSEKIERALGLDRARDAIIESPTKVTRAPLPLVVLFHGAGQSAEWMLGQVRAAADEAGVAVLAPNSRDVSWDAIRDIFGRDVAFVNQALERVFAAVAVDPARIAVGGFSDGASYALSLGLINGDLFSRVVAFSPGFVIERKPFGAPRFFISHGREDPILPIDRCGRRLVRELRERSYDVTFREFDGGHEIPADVARGGMQWVAGVSPP
ncbi:MAG TPA: PHB depolymerase family esterase [Blastocatellia bacterium]|nr:PHB depolymerase family esterase [Blastocatellia bacterium]